MPQLDMQRPSRSPPTSPPAGVGATASRFFVSMRNSLSPTSSRRKITDNPRAAMYSTPEERHAHSRASCSDGRPTIEQISMGLHVSRTPHIRPVPNSSLPPLLPCRSLDTPIHPPGVSPDTPHDAPSPAKYRTRHSLPPPPSRSSMKKTNPSASILTQPPQQLSSSDISPSSPATPGSGSPRPLSFLRARMSKFITGHRPLSLPSSLGRVSSLTSSASDSTRPTTPRKAVRFSTSVLGIDQPS